MKAAVVMPCHNVAAFVPRAIASVHDQGIAGLEVIAVDDASTDGTLEALRSISNDAFMRLRVIALQDRSGASAARNAGMAATDAEWVQFLDADDALRPGKILRQLAIAQRDKADAVAGAYINRFEDGRADEEVRPLEGDRWMALVRTRIGTTSANIFRRQAVLDAGGWDEGLRSSQDYELLFRMLKRDAVIAWDMEPGCEVLKRTRGSISRTGERENWLRYIELRRAMRDHLRGSGAEANAAVIAAADQYLFMAIRVLSAHDRRAAIDAFDQLLPKGFVPEANRATSAIYLFLFRMLGFRWAERLAGIKDALIGR
ncbi:MAG: glycosyltransferase family 2 protein [Flavobacteriales bacterium]|jgi:glycosyltransferase involved in cell wall biosynthesis|nr:glycosyltransferase family 2 protein [Flavobacteriales bacterium]